MGRCKKISWEWLLYWRPCLITLVVITVIITATSRPYIINKWTFLVTVLLLHREKKQWFNEIRGCLHFCYIFQVQVDGAIRLHLNDSNKQIYCFRFKYNKRMPVMYSYRRWKSPMAGHCWKCRRKKKKNQDKMHIHGYT